MHRFLRLALALKTQEKKDNERVLIKTHKSLVGGSFEWLGRLDKHLLVIMCNSTEVVTLSM